MSGLDWLASIAAAVIVACVLLLLVFSDTDD